MRASPSPAGRFRRRPNDETQMESPPLQGPLNNRSRPAPATRAAAPQPCRNVDNDKSTRFEQSYVTRAQRPDALAVVASNEPRQKCTSCAAGRATRNDVESANN